jgi:hypothetical protein
MTINDIQEAIITKLKAYAPLLTALGTASGEIREDQWQGIDFVYPAVRVEIGSISSVETQDNCNYWGNTFRVLVYSEQPSSLQANTIMSLVVDALHKKPITQNNVIFTNLHCSIINPAIRRDEKTWQANAQFTTHLQIKT